MSRLPTAVIPVTVDTRNVDAGVRHIQHKMAGLQKKLSKMQPAGALGGGLRASQGTAFLGGVGKLGPAAGVLGGMGGAGAALAAPAALADDGARACRGARANDQGRLGCVRELQADRGADLRGQLGRAQGARRDRALRPGGRQGARLPAVVPDRRGDASRPPAAAPGSMEQISDLPARSWGPPAGAFLSGGTFTRSRLDRGPHSVTASEEQAEGALARRCARRANEARMSGEISMLDQLFGNFNLRLEQLALHARKDGGLTWRGPRTSAATYEWHDESVFYAERAPGVRRRVDASASRAACGVATARRSMARPSSTGTPTRDNIDASGRVPQFLGAAPRHECRGLSTRRNSSTLMRCRGGGATRVDAQRRHAHGARSCTRRRTIVEATASRTTFDPAELERHLPDGDADGQGLPNAAGRSDPPPDFGRERRTSAGTAVEGAGADGDRCWCRRCGCRINGDAGREHRGPTTWIPSTIVTRRVSTLRHARNSVAFGPFSDGLRSCARGSTSRRPACPVLRGDGIDIPVGRRGAHHEQVAASQARTAGRTSRAAT
jgi:hypothetical protein